MALNVPMQNGPDGQFPLPYPGEVFLLTRDEVQMSFRDETRHAKHLKGRLFMTNLRYVPTNVAHFSAVQNGRVATTIWHIIAISDVRVLLLNQ